jgi:hypothetical protein
MSGAACSPFGARRAGMIAATLGRHRLWGLHSLRALVTACTGARAGTAASAPTTVVQSGPFGLGCNHERGLGRHGIQRQQRRRHDQRVDKGSHMTPGDWFIAACNGEGLRALRRPSIPDAGRQLSAGWVAHVLELGYWLGAPGDRGRAPAVVFVLTEMVLVLLTVACAGGVRAADMLALYPLLAICRA